MNGFENKNVETRAGEYGRAHKAVSGRPLVLEETSAMRREHKAPRPITFNGLLTNKLLAALPGPDFARLLPHLEPVSLVCDDNLYKFGEEIDFAYFPETAILAHVYFFEDGSTTGVSIVGREGMVGLSAVFNSRPPSYWTQVTVGGSALRVEMEVLRREFARGEAMQKLLLSYASARLAQLSQRAVCNGRHKLEERLCAWLLMLHDRASEEQLSLTHEEIAHHLGARRAGVTSCCNTLRDSGIINYRRGQIRILDRQQLEAAACECYRMFKLTVE